MASREELRTERLKKLDLITNAGGDPYPPRVRRSFSVSYAREHFDQLVQEEKIVSLVGRLRALRGHGRACFANIDDGTGTVQAYFTADALGKEYVRIAETIDVGDFLQVEGVLFRTHTGEETLRVSSFAIIAKSLLPLPDKWHSLQDKEERLRKRYLDILMNPDVKNRFIMRSTIIARIRKFMEAGGFLEVETPMLQAIPGGALARPFATHLNALDVDLYLRVAPELYLKRLLVAGFEKVFEIGRNFRNEGIDREHNPEFTMMECYAAYWDYEKMMGFMEDLVLDIIHALNNDEKNNQYAIGGKVIDFTRPWRRMPFTDTLKEIGIDYDAVTAEDLRQEAKKRGISLKPAMPKGKLADELYKKFVRGKLDGPVFLVDHPLDISPLAKKKPGNADHVERFQLVLGGMEIANAFSELNDPLDQKERFMAQEKERAIGDEESHRLDEDFIEALEYGMPPAAGLGLGIDRFAALLTGAENLREIILFPFMRPENSPRQEKHNE